MRISFLKRLLVVTIFMTIVLMTSHPAHAVDIYVSTFSNGKIYKIDSETGTQTVIASDLDHPEDMAIDTKGIMYIGGFFTGVKRIDIVSGARLSDVGTNICGPEGPAIDAEGNVYFNTRLSPCAASGIWKVTGGTALTATQVVPFFSGWGEGTAFLTHGPYAGCLIAADSTGGRIVRSCPPDFGTAVNFITLGNVVPVGIAVNSVGDIFISILTGGEIRHYDSNGVFKRVVASGPDMNPLFMEFDEADNLYVVRGGTVSVTKISPAGVQTDIVSTLPINPVGIAIPPSPKRLTGIRIIDTLSTANIDLDATSFSKPPASITVESDRTIIEWQFDSFSIGQIEDISFDVVLKNPFPGEDRLVNHKLELLYTDVNGNPVRTELGPQSVHVLASAFHTKLSTDKAQYTANENVLIDLSITNLSEFARTIDAVVDVEDRAGNFVAAVTTLSNLTFTAGEIKNFLDVIYNTGNRFAGDYRVHTRLIEAGGGVGEAVSNVTVLPVHQAASTITANKIAYTSNEPVTLTSTVTSLSPNSTLTGLNARISVYDPFGSIIFSETVPVSDLLPGARFELKSFTNTQTHPAGIYTATLQVQSHSNPLTGASTTFELLSSLTEGKALSGTIDAAPNTILKNETTAFIYSIQNTGNVLSLPLIAAVILIVDPDSGEAVQTLIPKSDIVLVGREVFSDSLLFNSMGLSPKAYLVILQAVIEGTTQVLASTGLTVTPDLDHFLGYKIVPKGPVLGFDPPLLLTDAFGTSAVDRILSKKLFNPAGKDHEGINDPDTHIERYQLLGQRPVLETNLKVTTLFGEIFIKKMKAESILVPTAKSLDVEGPPPDPPGSNVDHFQCYRLIKKKEVPPTKGMKPHLKDQFLDTNVTIQKPVRLCAPVEKVHNEATTSIKRPEKHLTCYKLKPVKHKVETQLTNQFDSEKKRTVKADELCVRSSIERLPDDDEDDDSDKGGNPEDDDSDSDKEDD